MPNDLLMLLGIGVLMAVISHLLKRWFGWEPELDDLQKSSLLSNSDGWSLYDCSSSHLDHWRHH